MAKRVNIRWPGENYGRAALVAKRESQRIPTEIGLAFRLSANPRRVDKSIDRAVDDLESRLAEARALVERLEPSPPIQNLDLKPGDKAR